MNHIALFRSLSPLALALLAAAAAALWPAIRLARVPPSVLLKVFSDER